MARRLEGIQPFSIDRMAAAAGDDPDFLRLENLDTDIPPAAAAIEATRDAVGRDDANSYLPFTGQAALKEAVAAHVARRGGPAYDPEAEVVITQGEGDNLLNALLAVTDPGDEVVLSDPTYAGMLNRVRLVGALPRLVPLRATADGWRMDADALRAAVTARTRAVFLASASFPSGWVADEREWATVAELCSERDLWLVYWAQMEAIVFGGRPVVHPAALPGMRDRTVICGTVSAEQRMIGWRVGWNVAPADLMRTLSVVHIYNGITTSGFGQIGAAAALAVDDVAEATAEWERRHAEVLRQCDGLPVVPAQGGWSCLLDAEAAGTTAPELSDRLLEQKVAATPMTAWGETVAPRHVRLVFSNEPVERLGLLGGRLRRALA